jgi:dissimilatory sulfite reductase (desulfoviridin) alpha/beta subunit
MATLDVSHFVAEEKQKFHLIEVVNRTGIQEYNRMVNSGCQAAQIVVLYRIEL